MNNFKSFWNSVIKSAKNSSKLKARAIFLQNCQRSKIIPQTLISRPPNNNSHGGNLKTSKSYKNVAKMASTQNVNIAVNDAKRLSEEAEKNHQYLLDNLMRNFNKNRFLKVKDRIENLTKEMIEQQNLNYQKKLHHLKIKNNIPIETMRIPGLTKPETKSRRFIKRRKYKKWKRDEASKHPQNLVHNLSSLELTTSMNSMLNRGLGFCPMPNTVNISGLQAEVDKYSRNIKWKEFFFEKEEENFTNVTNVTNVSNVPIVANVFKPQKTNLPSTRTPNSLQVYLGAIRSDILGSCKKPSCVKDNLTPMERAAIKDLQQAQSKGQIQIKPADKGGGMVIMDSCDYEDELLQQLKCVFTNEDSTTSPFYEEIQKKALDHQTKEVEKIIDKGFQMDFISKSDKDFMKPSDKPNQLYGLPKIHKGGCS